MTTYSGGKPVPSHPRQHPDFGPGNEISVHHGYYSPRRVDPLAAELVEMMVADPSLDYLSAPSMRPSLWAWARAEARTQMLSSYLADRAGDDGVGDLEDVRTSAAWALLEKAEAQATAGRKRLGLDPLSRAQLGKDIATGRQADAAAALTAMREDWERDRDGDDDG